MMSYRFLHSTKKAKSQIKAREQSKKECTKEEEIEQQSEEPFQNLQRANSTGCALSVRESDKKEETGKVCNIEFDSE